MKERSTAWTFWIPRGSPADKIPAVGGFPQSRAKVTRPFWTLVCPARGDGSWKKITKSYLNQWSIERRFDIEQGYLLEFFWKGTQASRSDSGVSMDGTRTEGGKGKAEQEEGLFQQYILRRNARVYRLTDSSCLPDTQAKPTPVVCIGQPLQEIGTPHQPFQIFSESRINGGTPYRRNQSPSGDRIFGDFSLYRDAVK